MRGATADTLTPEQRLQEMNAIVERIPKLQQTLLAPSASVSKSFVELCLRRNLTTFATHRNQMPPSMRSKAEYWLTLGRYYQIFSDAKESYRSFDLALKADPKNVEARWLTLKAWQSFSRQNLTQAPSPSQIQSITQRTRDLIMPLLDLKGDVALRNKQIEALRFFAQFLEITQQDHQAASEWKRLLALAPTDTQAATKVATWHLARGDTASASALLESLLKAGQIEPFFIETLASIRMDEGALPEAEALLVKYLREPTYKARVTPSMRALYLRILIESERPAEADKFYASLSDAERKSKEIIDARQSLQLAQARQDLANGLKGKAITVFMNYLKTHPHDRRVAFEAAHVLVDGGNPRDKTVAAQLLSRVAGDKSSLTKSQLEFAVQTLSSVDGFKAATANACDRLKEEFDAIGANTVLPCAQAWVATRRKDLAKEELEKVLKTQRGTPMELPLLKSLTAL